MEMHPSRIPVGQLFDIKDFSDASKAMNEMLAVDLQKTGLKVLLPKEREVARRLGYMIVNELNRGFRNRRYKFGIKYFVYHHDPEHYAVVIAGEEVLAKL